jgi:hypothetical protein
MLSAPFPAIPEGRAAMRAKRVHKTQEAEGDSAIASKPHRLRGDRIGGKTSSRDEARSSIKPLVLIEGKKKRDILNDAEFRVEWLTEITDRLARGEALTTICADEHMPSLRSVHRWQVGREDVRAALSQARDVAAERLYDEIRTIADGVPADAVAINKARLMIDARKWWLERHAPARFGNAAQKVVVEGGDRPIMLQRLDYSTLDATERAILEGLLRRRLAPPTIEGEAQEVSDDGQA